jgi:hypothetical protein
MPDTHDRRHRGAGRRCFLEFFTVNIRNRNTRAAYARAARAFLAWCEERGLGQLQDVQHLLPTKVLADALHESGLQP